MNESLATRWSLFRQLTLALLSVTLLTSTLHATPVFEQAKNTEGISNNSVLSLLQDRQGYIWMGTYDGLNRYDGKRIDVFRLSLDQNDHLSGNIIEGLYPSNDEYIWVFSGMGLDRFSTKTFKVTKKFPQLRWGRQMLAADTIGNLFAYEPDASLSYYDPHNEVFRKAEVSGLPAQKDVRGFFILPDASVGIFTEAGKMIQLKFDFSKGYDEGNAKFSRHDIDLHPKTIINAFPGNDGFYFVDTDRQLFHCDSGNRISYVSSLSDVPVEHITGIEAFGRDILIGLTGYGLGRVIGADHNRFEMLSTDTGIFSLMPDRRQPLLWCATDGRGLYMAHNAPTPYHAILSSQIAGLSKPIRAFNTDSSGNLWIGTKGDGLFHIKDYKRFDNRKPIPAEYVRRFNTSDGLPDDQVFDIADSRFHKGKKWIATRGEGISYIEMSSGKITTLQHPSIVNIHDIVEENDSVLWLASTTEGLLRVAIDISGPAKTIRNDGVRQFTFSQHPHVCSEIYSIEFDGDSFLYIGCRGGLGIVKFNIKNHEYDFIRSITDKFPAIGDIISLYYNDSTLYFGSSAGAGIIDFSNPDSEPRILSHNRGMINDMAHSILSDSNGNVWISTNKGLVRYDPDNDRLHNIPLINGLINEFCDNAGYISASDGNVIFGALNGIAWIDTDYYSTPSVDQAAPFFFNRIQVNGRERNINEMLDKNGAITLSSDENTIKIAFSTLDFINGNDFNYFYKLEGYNDDWINIGTSPEMTFTNLPPGKYVLKIKYQSDRVGAHDEQYTLPIIVRQPWYFSTPAIIIYVVVIGIMILLAIHIIRKIYRRKRDMLEKELYEHQQEQLYNERMEFFKSITHELCTPLTMITGLCDRLKETAGDEHGGKIGKYIDSMKLHSRQLNDLIQEILDIRKIQERKSRTLVVQPIRLENIFEKWVYPFRDIANNNDINFETSIDNPDLRWNTDRSSMGKIISNLTSNAFKYTPAGGTIKVSCGLENNNLHISVFNTGEGISAEKLPLVFDKYMMFKNADTNGYRQLASRHGLGLFICKEETERLGGTISVNSEAGKYVRFDVVLPSLDVQEKETGTVAVSEPVPDPFAASDRPAILVVDDNPDILWLVADILGDNYEVLTARSPEEAFEKIRHKLPALIISDVMMPDMEGIEFVKQLRLNKFTKYLPVIILSAKITETDKMIGFESGADAYITKPFNPEYLKILVSRLLARKKTEKDYYTSSESAVTIHEGLEITNEDKEFFDKLKEIIAENIEDEAKLKPAELARAAGVELRTLYRKFKRSSPYTPTEFVKQYRYSYAARLLLTSNMNIQEIIYKVGLTNKTVFYNDFKKIYGMTPKEYRESKK